MSDRIINVAEITEDFNKNTKYCAQVWNGAVVDVTGKGAVCCEIGYLLEDTHITKNTLSEFQQNPKVEELRRKMLNSEEPRECKNCFNIEREGVISLRHSLNKDYIKRNNGTFPLKTTVENLEIRFGNLCQLECVMCHPSRSKKVENVIQFVKKTDEDLFNNQFGHFYFDNINFDSSWCEDESVFDAIVEQSRDVKRLFLNGGEPLLSKAHNGFLQKLIDANLAKNIDLVYSTNFLLGEQKHFDLWKQFKHVSITLSLDDLYERNRFIRYPSNWDKVKTALDFFYDETKKYRNIEIKVWKTITSLNYAYTLDFFEFFESNYPNLYVEMRAVQDPQFLDPAHLPQAVKQKISDPLLKFFDDHDKYKIQGIPKVNHILHTQDDPEKLKAGMDYFKIYGKYRNMNERELFKQTFDLLEMDQNDKVA